MAGCVDSPEAVNQVVCMCLMISGQAQARMRKKSGKAGTATQDAGAEVGSGGK